MSFLAFAAIFKVWMCLLSSPNASPDFEGRGGEALALEIQTVLARAYKNNAAIDYSALSVLSNKHCWLLNVDILVRFILHNCCFFLLIYCDIDLILHLEKHSHEKANIRNYFWGRINFFILVIAQVWRCIIIIYVAHRTTSYSLYLFVGVRVWWQFVWYNISCCKSCSI